MGVGYMKLLGLARSLATRLREGPPIDLRLTAPGDEFVENSVAEHGFGPRKPLRRRLARV